MGVGDQNGAQTRGIVFVLELACVTFVGIGVHLLLRVKCAQVHDLTLSRASHFALFDLHNYLALLLIAN